MRIRGVAWVVAGVAGVGVLLGCGGATTPAPVSSTAGSAAASPSAAQKVVRFKASGSGKIDVTYMVNGVTSQHNGVDSPYAVDVPTATAFNLVSMVVQDKSGNAQSVVSCTVTNADGKVTTNQSSGLYAVVTC